MLSVSEEQLRLFLERARLAERLSAALEQQVLQVRQAGGGGGPSVGVIEASTKESFLDSLRSLKQEVTRIETTTSELQQENQSLTKEKNKLEYRIEHMRRALQQFQQPS